MSMTAIIALGFLFRLPGVLFYGTYDMDSWVFGWGDAVLHDGLAKGYTGDGAYGILSYAFSALATKFALLVPRFWFLPHKVAEISIDAATLYLMLQLVPERYRKRLAAFFWLNPLFILHGAWQG